ncbi:hypothetical protein J1N09_10975 [Aureitalea sp. L0-47]|uniref:hypothetical protein n=1 Tax=Aureitalea sp. L0-47 TaxID=2816962 RepID=UPI0022375235|nr:hypothetical protein [Aureitalea sp. L0-47]MCW5520365.1 hypothetical protein [Aureitalea sp. L0-47]
MLRKFAKHTILFFIPVIIGCVILEVTTRKLPMRYTFIAEHLQSNKDSIQVLALGSSQMKDALNPEWLDFPTINLASTNQHLNTDFKLYKGLKDKLPALTTVVMEVTYSHLELNQNDKEFWKNNIFFEYYNVNCFERPTWFKDRLIFFSNPPFYSDALYDEYLTEKNDASFNSYGYNLNNYQGGFKSNNYDIERIENLSFKITTKENLRVFELNSNYLIKMLEEFEKDDLNVVIVSTPFHPIYLEKMNKIILKRRDSVLRFAKTRFPNVSLLNLEADTTTFKTRDYINHNHLNTDGSRKFTAILNDFLRK